MLIGPLLFKGETTTELIDGVFDFKTTFFNVTLGTGAGGAPLPIMELFSGWTNIGWLGSGQTASGLAYDIDNNSTNAVAVTSVTISKWNNAKNSWDGYIYGVSPAHYDFELVLGGGYFIYTNAATDLAY